MRQVESVEVRGLEMGGEGLGLFLVISSILVVKRSTSDKHKVILKSSRKPSRSNWMGTYFEYSFKEILLQMAFKLQ